MQSDHFIPKEKHVFSMTPDMSPALEVNAPCTITFETNDMSWSRLEQGETIEAIGFQNFNPVTGPVFVKGAEPGDSLRIEVLDITVNSAWSGWLPNVGRWGSKTDRVHVRRIPMEDGYAVINENIKVPLDPMIGCVSMAPASGSSSTVFPAYPWGGNLDLRELRPGSTIYLPVQVTGGLLAIGDLHAAMGTAEPTAISLESAGQAVVRVGTEKGMAIKYPRVRVDNQTLLVAPADDFGEARQIAMDLAYDFLTDELRLEPFDAFAYASACVELRFGGPACAIVVAVVPDIIS